MEKFVATKERGFLVSDALAKSSPQNFQKVWLDELA
jgi:hypothetical protein